MAIERTKAVKAVLGLLLYCMLWRTTGMWYGYPAIFEDKFGADPFPMQMLLYSAIPLIGLYVVLEPERFIFYVTKVPLAVVLLLGVFAVSILVSIDMGSSIRAIVALSLMTIGTLLFRMRFGAEETFRYITRFLTFAVFFNLAYTLAFPRFAIMGGEYAGMVKGAFIHKNGMGQFMSVATVVLYLLRDRVPARLLPRFINWAAIVCAMLLIVASRSSTSVVMTVAAVLIAISIRRLQNLPGKTVRSGILLAIAVALTSTFAVAYLGVAAAIAAAFDKDLTFSGRTVIWEQLVYLIAAKPLLGYGFSVFRLPDVMYRYVSVTFSAKSTHNTYLEAALNIGIPGTLLWLSFVFSRIYAKAMRYRPGDTSAVEIAILFQMMVGAMMEAGVFLSPTGIWPYIVISLCAYESDAARRRQL